MPVSRSDVEAFFAAYAAALGARDAKAIAGHWGVPALVLSDQGALAVSAAAETEAFFAASMDQYRDAASAHPTLKHLGHLGEAVVACEIVWEHRDKFGEPIGGEQGHYMLRRGEDGLRIHVYSPNPGA
jgi:ketosteroid isomerase-like protein